MFLLLMLDNTEFIRQIRRTKDPSLKRRKKEVCQKEYGPRVLSF